jgi:cytochrome d ubiquinol oxidase subunit I
MDVETLSRIQFALTIMFHYIYPPLSIGLGVVMVIIEGMYMKTGKPIYLQAAKFWTRIFAVTFAIGVATGIVMEFEFGTNWATYSRYVGDVFGSALAAEGIFAFFLESGFLALLLFGWNRIGPKLHYFATIMVCLGAHFSAIWIVVANSWMQTPAGFKIVGEGLAARAEITDFWTMVLNPSSVVRISHVVVGAWLAGAFLVISVAAYYLLKSKHKDFAKISLKVGLFIASISVVLQFILGHMSGQIVAQHQPLKLAAFEGIYKTESYAPLSLFGIPDSQNKTLRFNIAIPGLLSFVAMDRFDAEITGLEEFPREDWPNVPAVFHSYHIMVFCWALMTFIVIWSIWRWFRRNLYEGSLFLPTLVGSVVLPQIANQAGWMAAEMGRFPWIVYNQLRISEGLSKSVTANQVLGSIIMFGVVYTFLFFVFVYLLNEKFKHGPLDEDFHSPYQNLRIAVKETTS